MKIAIVGLGLIGGSVALELKRRSLGTIRVFGVEENITHADRALELELVDQVMTLTEAIKTADIIIVAIPVNVIQDILPNMLDKLSPQQVVIDLGSTKKAICDEVKNHANRGRYVAAHPLAGTEFSGPEAAILDLFRGKKNIICEKDKSAVDAIEKAERIFKFLGMQSYFLEADEHDKHLAYVSHLSHISAFTLSLTVQEIEKDEKQIFNLASTGFSSTARLAKSNAETWGPIFDANAKYLVEAIDLYIDNLNNFKKTIQNKDLDAAKAMMKQGNEIKRVLEGIK